MLRSIRFLEHSRAYLALASSQELPHSDRQVDNFGRTPLFYTTCAATAACAIQAGARADCRDNANTPLLHKMCETCSDAEVCPIPQLHCSTPLLNSTPRPHSSTPLLNSTAQLHCSTPLLNSTPQLHSSTPLLNSTPQLHSSTPLLNSTPHLLLLIFCQIIVLLLQV
jgi:hypothetical protein